MWNVEPEIKQKGYRVADIETVQKKLWTRKSLKKEKRYFP